MTALAGRSQLQALSKDHGAAGSLLIVGVCLSAVLAFLASAVLIDWFAVARRAEQAAELAALAAISAELRGESGCLAAASTATRNDAVVAQCNVRGGGNATLVAVVTVEAAFRHGPEWLPRVVRREATAGT